jgi:UDP-N-acetylglucosamine:LPS N-acetylglucosamine transferase
MKALLVASGGGHLAHLLWLHSWWQSHERVWVTFDTPDARSRLEHEVVYWASHPTNRNVRNALKNTLSARAILAAEQPDLVVSTGAGVAVPFLALARLQGVPTVFVEVVDRITRPSLTARLVAPWVDELVLQWPEQRAALGRGTVIGPILGALESKGTTP